MPITLNGSGTITGITEGGLPDAIITTAELKDGSVITSKILDAQVTSSKLGADFSQQLCKAWVNFNGTGTVAIRGSYNVSSITDNGLGDYTVNFTNSMNSPNYSISAICSGDAANAGVAYFGVDIYSTGITSGYNSLSNNSVRLRSRGTNTTDPDVFCVSIFN